MSRNKKGKINFILFIYFQGQIRLKLMLVITTTQSAPVSSHQNDFTTQAPNKKDAIELDEGMSKARPVHPG